MISFIVIGRNEGWRLKKCLDSLCVVVKQDNISDYEIIYVDSKSTDDSINLAKSYKDINVYSITGECNSAIARNIGAKKASGDILFFVDGDMEIQCGFINTVIDSKTQKLHYPFVSGVWNDIVYKANWEYSYSIERDKEAIDRIEQTTGGLFIIDADLWARVGGMDNRLKRHQDLDLGFRLFKLGFPLHRKKELLALHHTTPYTDREIATGYYKYTGLFFRKHFFSKRSIRIILFNQYTSLFFLLSIIFTFFGLYFFWGIYLFLLLYRSLKSYIKQKDMKLKKLLRIIKFMFIRDIVFLISVVAYYPSTPNLNYVKL